MKQLDIPVVEPQTATIQLPLTLRYQMASGELFQQDVRILRPTSCATGGLSLARGRRTVRFAKLLCSATTVGRFSRFCIRTADQHLQKDDNDYDDRPQFGTEHLMALSPLRRADVAKAYVTVPEKTTK